MKNHFLKIIFINLLPLFGFCQDATTLTKLGQMAPAFSLELEKGKTASLADFKGQVVMINFFATWCGPCRQELPRVQAEIWDKYKNNPKFKLFVLGREEGWDKMLKFKADNLYTFQILPDEGRKVYGLFATQSIPRNVVIDGTGKIIYQSIGYEQDEFNRLLQLLDKQMKQAK